MMTMDPIAGGIESPRPRDILLGRGAGVYNHHGNMIFRQLVDLNKELYSTCPPHYKIAFARTMTELIMSQDPPGRYLEKSKTNGLYYEVDYKAAVKKTQQCLREPNRKPSASRKAVSEEQARVANVLMVGLRTRFAAALRAQAAGRAGAGAGSDSDSAGSDSGADDDADARSDSGMDATRGPRGGGIGGGGGGGDPSLPRPAALATKSVSSPSVMVGTSTGRKTMPTSGGSGAVVDDAMTAEGCHPQLRAPSRPPASVAAAGHRPSCPPALPPAAVAAATTTREGRPTRSAHAEEGNELPNVPAALGPASVAPAAAPGCTPHFVPSSSDPRRPLTTPAPAVSAAALGAPAVAPGSALHFVPSSGGGRTAAGDPSTDLQHPLPNVPAAPAPAASSAAAPGCTPHFMPSSSDLRQSPTPPATIAPPLPPKSIMKESTAPPPPDLKDATSLSSDMPLPSSDMLGLVSLISRMSTIGFAVPPPPSNDDDDIIDGDDAEAYMPSPVMSQHPHPHHLRLDPKMPPDGRGEEKNGAAAAASHLPPTDLQVTVSDTLNMTSLISRMSTVAFPPEDDDNNNVPHGGSSSSSSANNDEAAVVAVVAEPMDCLSTCMSDEWVVKTKGGGGEPTRMQQQHHHHHDRLPQNPDAKKQNNSLHGMGNRQQLQQHDSNLAKDDDDSLLQDFEDSPLAACIRSSTSISSTMDMVSLLSRVSSAGFAALTRWGSSGSFALKGPFAAHPTALAPPIDHNTSLTKPDKMKECTSMGTEAMDMVSLISRVSTAGFAALTSKWIGSGDDKHPPPAATPLPIDPTAPTTMCLAGPSPVASSKGLINSSNNTSDGDDDDDDSLLQDFDDDPIAARIRGSFSMGGRECQEGVSQRLMLSR